jgi:hypothetical protein
VRNLNVPNVNGVVLPDDVPGPVEPAVDRLNRVCDAYRAGAGKLRDLVAQRDAATVADRQAGAAALLDGRVAPAPTVAKVDAQIDMARQQLDVLESACGTGVAELIGAINAAADDWRVELHDRRVAAAEGVRAALTSLATAVAGLGEDEATIAWLDAIGSDELRLEATYSGSGRRLSKWPKPAGSLVEHNVTAALDAITSWVESVVVPDDAHEPVG